MIPTILVVSQSGSYMEPLIFCYSSENFPNKPYFILPKYLNTLLMSGFINPNAEDFLIIDTSEMIEVDRLMIEAYHIELIQMMENAGRCLAIVARETFLQGDPQDKQIAIFAGTGGNGGGALVCARRLHNWGAQVQVNLTASPEKMTPIPRHQYTILKRMGIKVAPGITVSKNQHFDLLIDGIIGYSVKGDPYGIPREMIHWLNSHSSPVLSLDTPSGLDLTTGTLHAPTVTAQATLTLAMPKEGLFKEDAKRVVGDLYLGDISVPPSLYAEPSLGRAKSNPFRYSDIVQIF